MAPARVLCFSILLELLQFSALLEARCICSDVRPRIKHDGPPMEFGCREQKQFGKCNDPFMFTTIEELPEGYCQITCGRCDCCDTFRHVLQARGLSDFIAAMDIAGYGGILNQPGTMMSLLAPRPEAISEWLDQQEAVWTAPFFLEGNLVPTLSARFGALYTTKSAEGVSFIGPYNSVDLMMGEGEACKGFVYIVDGVFSSVDLARGRRGNK